MKPVIRVPLTLTIIVVVTGIIAFIKIGVNAQPFPIAYFLGWIIVSAALIGITYSSWRRNRNEEE